MNTNGFPASLRAVGLSASPNADRSRSGQLLDAALVQLETLGVAATRIDLGALNAEALLGRKQDANVEEALALVTGADLLLSATPIYRATYSGLLKVFLDLLPNVSLSGKVVVPIAVGGGPSHMLAIDHGLRPLFTSLGAVVVATGVFASPEHFLDGGAERALLERLDRALEEAIGLASSLARVATHPFMPSRAPAPAEPESATLTLTTHVR